MLTIKDLPASKTLDKAALGAVRGGYKMPELPSSFFSIANAPIIDNGFHHLAQGQALGVDQSHNLGGLNLVISDQTQNGVSGQVVS